MPREYATAKAFRRALEVRLGKVAETEQVQVHRLRRQVAFDRLLARLFRVESAPWTLKGGYALELRFKTARATIDFKLTEEEVRPSFPGRGGRGEGGRGEGRGGGEETGDTAAPSAGETVKTWMAFDKNGDGKLSKDEVPERMQGVFDRADSNKDGALTVDEIRLSAQAQAAPSGGRGGREGGRGEGMSFMRIDPILAALDTDGDGVISAGELSNAPASLKKLDKNGDGQLTQDEVRVNMPGRGGRGPGGPEHN